MSPNPYPLFSVSQSDTPEQIKLKIRMLTRLYLKDPYPYIAEGVVKHIAAILAYPKYIDDIEQRCKLRTLEVHWRCLAWIGNSEQRSKHTGKPDR
jgi:hypothetical protein